MAKCKITVSILFLFLVSVLINSADAATIEVHPGESIQYAIDQASSGDEVFIFSGLYTENIVMKNGINVTGAGYGRVEIKGNVLFKDAASILKDVTIVFPQGDSISYTNTYYTNWQLAQDAGITAINSSPTVQNCAIKPGLDNIIPDLERYGNGIQIWNMYQNPDVAPKIEGNLIQNTECGIYYFSQTFGSAVGGSVKNNTFYNDKYGIILRMHRENPHIYNNIFANCPDAVIFYTYEDGELYAGRQLNLNNNLFYEYAIEGWLDSREETFDIVGLRDNISENPLFIDPENGVFYLSSGDSPCIGMGQDGADIGSHAPDLQNPVIESILPAENRLIGQLNVDISGTAADDNGIACVFINSEPAIITGTTFLKEDYALTYGLNDIVITARDVAQKEVITTKPIYVFKSPAEPPQ